MFFWSKKGSAIGMAFEVSRRAPVTLDQVLFIYEIVERVSGKYVRLRCLLGCWQSESIAKRCDQDAKGGTKRTILMVGLEILRTNTDMRGIHVSLYTAHTRRHENAITNFGFASQLKLKFVPATVIMLDVSSAGQELGLLCK